MRRNDRLLGRLVPPGNRRTVGWFPLSDAQPEPDEAVLACVLDGDVVVRTWHPPGPMFTPTGEFVEDSGPHGWWEGHEIIQDGGAFTYWMPFPVSPSVDPATLPDNDPNTWAKRVPGSHLYIAQARVSGAVKIGRSENPRARVRELQTGCPYRLRLLLVADGQGDREPELHHQLDRYRLKVTGEWFAPECLQDLPDDLHRVLDHAEVARWWRGSENG